jgi:hypothetical protein
MKLEEHCQECLEVLGKDFREVNIWLDEFAGTPHYKMRHRKVRHHEAGIQESIKLFGEVGGRAARLHIISDLKIEGWKEGDHFPQDERDYVRMGLY